jgi:sodium transport system ATP-binding protein
MIETQLLHKRFGDTVAVEEASFTAPDGCITGLLGPNGAGKTTTLGLIAGLLRPDRGRVLVGGRDPAQEPMKARRRLGYLPDAAGLYPRLTAREHLLYFGRLHGLRGAALAQAVDRTIELLELGALAGRRAQGFSQGERRKLALGCALVADPPNVVLDEPTNGLDVMSTRSLRRRLGRLRDQGRAVLFSSHVFQEVTALCGHIVVLAHGRVVAQGTPHELIEATGKAGLEEAFLDRVGAQEATA